MVSKQAKAKTALNLVKFPFIGRAVPADNFGTGSLTVFVTPLGTARLVTVFANSRLSLRLLPSVSFRANECESRNLHTFDTVLVISVKRSLDSASLHSG